MDTEFVVDVFQVIVDRVGRDKQLVPDLLVLKPLRQKFEDFEFTVCQIISPA